MRFTSIESRFGLRNKFATVAQRWFEMHNLPIFLSWRLWSKDESMRIHRCVIRVAFPHSPRYVWWSATLVSILLWPVRSLWLTRLYTKHFGPDVYRAVGKSLIRQSLEQVSFALIHSISPSAYYTYGLYEEENRNRATRYIQDYESMHLLPFLNNYQSTTILDDKLAFEQLCSQNGLATTSTVAITEEGHIKFCDPAQDRLPQQSLFIKPVVGFHGQGAMLWEYVSNGFYRSRKQEISAKEDDYLILHHDHLIQHLIQSSQQRSLLIQLQVTNHPSISDLSSGSLLSARVLTGIENGQAELIRAVLKLPIGQATTNNDGMAAPINEKTGVLGVATINGPNNSRYTHLPGTQTAILERALPDWDKAVELAICGHQLLQQFTFIGWDIAFTKSGPILLEGNWGWGIETLQKPYWSPLTDTRFAAICLNRITELQNSTSSGHRKRISGHRKRM